MNAHLSLKQIIEERTTIIPIAGCWLWLGALSEGYGDIRTKDRHLRAHRASYEAFVGPVPQGLWVLHRCDTRACCNPHHLFLGTRQDNIDDAAKKGRLKNLGRRRPKGLKYKRPLAYLDGKVAELNRTGMSINSISKQLGIQWRTVKRAIRDTNL